MCVDVCECVLLCVCVCVCFHYTTVLSLCLCLHRVHMVDMYGWQIGLSNYEDPYIEYTRGMYRYYT